MSAAQTRSTFTRTLRHHDAEIRADESPGGARFHDHRQHVHVFALAAIEKMRR
jgi:hypothetical protein